MTLVLAVKANPGTATSAFAEVIVRPDAFNRSAVATGGTGTITLDAIDSSSPNAWWHYESIKIICDSVNIPDITMYEDEVANQHFIGGSDRGDLNEWAESPPLRTKKAVILQWTNADANSNCYARIQRVLIELVPVRI